MTDASNAARLAAAAADLTLADILSTQAIVRPDATAVVMGETELSYRDLDALAERLAAGLIQAGLQRGDRLAVLSRNSLPFVLLFHAAAKAGIAIAALNWRSSPAELTRALRLVEPAFVAVASAQAELLDQTDCPLPRIALDDETTGGPVVSFGDLKRAAPRSHEVHAEDIVSIVFTSGSTGDPKAVAISQRALLARASVIGIDWQLDVGDAFVGWAPLFHISSSDYVFTTAVLSGTFVVLDGFDASAIVEIARSRKIGWMFLVPGTVELFVDALGDQPLPPSQMKLVGVMADLISPTTMQGICTLTGAQYLNSFGMTETGLVPCVPSFTRTATPAGGSLPKAQSAFCSVRLVGDDGRDVPDGEPGELWVRSPTLASGYWNNAAATEASFSGGWYHTGDVLRRTGDGALQFVGRVSGMIKSGGENIYPAEIERALLSHPSVSEAAAIGVPHTRWGETPVAFVSLIEGEQCGADELKTFLRQQIASYKIPQEIRIIPYCEFTRNVTGKIDRAALRLKVTGPIA